MAMAQVTVSNPERSAREKAAVVTSSVDRPSRRQFIAVATVGLLAGCGRISLPGVSRRTTRIGYLSLSSAELTATNDGIFLGALRELGYADGESLIMEYRRAEGRDERLPDLATELVQLPVDLIVATSASAAIAAARATRTIPIVLTGAGDPVGSGLAESLAHPGGNVTGLTIAANRIIAKRLELLKTAAPHITRVGILADPSQQTVGLGWQESQDAARDLDVTVERVDARRPEELEAAFVALTSTGCDALSPQPSPLFTNQRRRLVELATAHRLPAIYQFQEFARDGLFLAYGPNLAAGYRRAATYVDRILKGANPATLPIEQPVVFDFVINLRTARAFGLDIPPSVLAQATEVIQ